MLKVSSLIDVVESQLCLHGDHKLFVEPAPKHEFTLYVNDSVSGQILDCQNYDDSSIGESSLQVLSERLAVLDEDAIVSISDMDALLGEFQIGFKSDEGFIETIHSTELSQDVIIDETPRRNRPANAR